jgi:hypothetical protein
MSVKGGARAGEVSNEEMQEFRMKPSFKKEACAHKPPARSQVECARVRKRVRVSVILWGWPTPIFLSRMKPHALL